MFKNDTITLPNSLTIVRIILTPVFFLLFISEDLAHKQFSLIVYLIAALTDWYDGWVARKWGYVTRFGIFMDPLADKVLSSSALIAFTYMYLIDAWMVWIIVIRDILITVLRSIAEYKNQPIVTSSTAKAKTTVQYIVIYYILVLYVIRSTPFLEKNYPNLFYIIDGLLNTDVLFGMMLLVTILTVWTGFSYIYTNRKNISVFFTKNE